MEAGQIMKKIVLFCLASLSIQMAVLQNHAKASECPGRSDDALAYSHGTEPYYEGQILYESKARDGGGGSVEYYWCVENALDNLSVDIRWGDNYNEGRFFSTLVAAGEHRIREDSDIGGYLREKKSFKYRRLIVGDWSQKDTQTVIPDVMTDVSFDQENSDKKYFSKLDGYLKENGKYIIHTFATFDLPTSSKIRDDVADSNYDRYNPDDFSTMGIFLDNYVYKSDEGVYFSELFFSIRYDVDESDIHKKPSIENSYSLKFGFPGDYSKLLERSVIPFSEGSRDIIKINTNKPTLKQFSVELVDSSGRVFGGLSARVVLPAAM